MYIATALSCVLHVVVYAHYRGACPGSIEPGDAGRRREAIHVSLSVPAGGKPAGRLRSQDFREPVAPAHIDSSDARKQQRARHEKSIAASPGTHAGPHPDEPYYTLDMLDRSARPMSGIDIAAGLLSSIRSRLLLELWIDRSGDVRKVQLIEPARTSEALQPVIRSLQAIRFLPAVRGGLPVNSRKFVELAVDGPESLPPS